MKALINPSDIQCHLEARSHRVPSVTSDFRQRKRQADINDAIFPTEN